MNVGRYFLLVFLSLFGLLKHFSRKRRDILHQAWHSSADFTDPSKQRTLYWRLGILHGDVWVAVGAGGRGGMCRVEVKGRRENTPSLFLGRKKSRKEKEVGRSDRQRCGGLLFFFLHFCNMALVFLWSNGSRFGAGASDMWRETCDAEEEGWNDRGSRQPSALHAVPRLGRHRFPPFASILEARRRHLPIRVTHPPDGRHRKRRLAGERTLDETEYPTSGSVFSRHGRSAPPPTPDMAAISVYIAADHGLFSHVSFHGRSLSSVVLASVGHDI